MNRSSYLTQSNKGQKLLRFATLIAGLGIFGLTRPVWGFDAAAEFSTVNNPSGVWSYGNSLTLGGAFSLDASNETAYGGTALTGWSSYLSAGGAPYVVHNGTANPVTIQFTTYQPGQLAEHPGGNGEFSIVRWTAPYAFTFTIAATFRSISSVGGSVDVHIRHNGTSIFDSTVIGSGSSSAFSGQRSVGVGDTIDFIVGYGSNGNANEDTTALSATIIPEPTTFALLGAGLLGLGVLRWLRRI
jgi:hypothetical protein